VSIPTECAGLGGDSWQWTKRFDGNWFIVPVAAVNA
jgi:hypothetical protein